MPDIVGKNRIIACIKVKITIHIIIHFIDKLFHYKNISHEINL